MVRSRRGTSRLGCLFSLLLMVTVAYFGANVGEVYLRYFRMRDAMDQEARFASSHDDDQIKQYLVAMADSLGLPESAGRVLIRRGARGITISSQYSEHVELPLFVREFHFAPSVERRF